MGFIKGEAVWQAAWAHAGLFLALAVYLGLALSYFFITPIFEAPDEWTHTGHVKYIAEGNGLPVMLPGRGIWGGQQPPLYYAIGAMIVQPFELAEFDGYSERTRNPHASLGYALDPGNKNNYLHAPNEGFPYRGLALTVHVLRLYSMMYGLIALVFAYLTAYELMVASHPPEDEFKQARGFATTVALLMACQPMFAFITASVANEPANIAFSAIGLWLAQRYVLRGPAPGAGRAIALGIVLGLISISKMTGLAFGLVAVVALLISIITTRKQSGAALRLWRDGLIIGLLFLLAGGWWYWRNYQLYGDFFQQGLYKIYFNVDPQPLTLSDFLYTLSTSEVSFWATFGWLNIVGPDWLYSFYWLVSRIGLASAALFAGGVLFQSLKNRLTTGERRTLNRKAVVLQNDLHNTDDLSPRYLPGYSTTPGISPSGRNDRLYKFFRWTTSLITFYVLRFTPPSSTLLPLTLHAVFPLALAFSLTRLVATEGGLQGRQLLPALGSLAILIMWGWWMLCPARLRRPILGALLAALFGLALWLPYGVVAREYIPAALLTKADLPPDLNRLDLTFNGEMKLIGAEIGLDKVRPGERVPVTVYWQALRPMTVNYSVFVHLIGRNYENAGQFNSYPGLGLRPTTTLQPGQIVKDTYPVLVNGGSQAPTRLLVNVGLFNIKEAGRPGLPAINPAGQEVGPTVGQLKLIPVTWPPAGEPVLAEFADHIALERYSVEGCATRAASCTVTFKWLAQGRPAANYTVFIQLWQRERQIAGFDGPPLQNDYPTGLWEAGEVILDPHPLDLSGVSPGDYRLVAGLYQLASGDRLAASAQGQPLPNDVIDLGMIQVR